MQLAVRPLVHNYGKVVNEMQKERMGKLESNEVPRENVRERIFFGHGWQPFLTEPYV